MDKFLARTERYQTLMLSVVHRLGLDHLDAGDGRTPQELADAVLAAAAAQHAVGRRPSGIAPDGHDSPLTS
ncbi:hypothetical protein ACH4YO_14035 [Streptomyces noursei]|nr:hypothetical protein SNOUR_04175 [Streptomyces noursei ATCC 11455]